MKNKTKQLLTFIAQNYMPVTVTSLMKLSYLIDLVSFTKGDPQISDFTYRRYKYGPFDSKIYKYLNDLVNTGVILAETEFTPQADEYIIYKFNEKNQNVKFDALTEDEIKTVEETLKSLRGLGAKALSEITYKTKPMKALGAQPGNDKGLNEVLHLKIE
jgi:uncharacterized phage-associated protein